jgi:hypothetical protein
VDSPLPFRETGGSPKEVHAQTHADSSIHSWYRLRLGYSDHLVGSIIDEFKVDPQTGVVLDPFCGAGTTIVECKKQGISSIGIDANPSSCFATRVKTHWRVNEAELSSVLCRVERLYRRLRLKKAEISGDQTFRYAKSAGLLERGWICEQPLREAIAIKRAILGVDSWKPYANFLTLSLLSEVVEGASNVKFGPELYCGPPKHRADVFGGFKVRTLRMIEDLRQFRPKGKIRSRTFQGDSRNLSCVLDGKARITSVICSPPYPAEHDYTRNSRLELAFLEHVGDIEELRTIKKAMLRCHTKGIYKTDSDGDRILLNSKIMELAEEIGQRASTQTSGFSRLYASVVKEYFGGMLRHFESLLPLLKPGAKCAYIVGDQSNYLQVHIPTAAVLGQLAEQAGFECIDIRLWRTRYVSSTKRTLNENVLLLRKPRGALVNFR